MPGSEKVGIVRRRRARKDEVVSIKGAKDAPVKLRMSKRKLVLSKVTYLAERLGGVSHVAEAVQTDKSRVSRWAKGGAFPDAQNTQTIDDLEFIYQRLSRFLSDSTADKWLNSANSFLHGKRPIDVVHEGRVVDVLSAADQEEAGSFA